MHPNETAVRFGYPATLVHEYEHWLVLVRSEQITAGSLVVACRGEETSFGQLPREACAELADVTADLERTLAAELVYDKINYLMLMMVDPHVHFHVLPRYAAEREVCGVRFVDTGWPKTPALAETVPMTPEQLRELTLRLRAAWPQR